MSLFHDNIDGLSTKLLSFIVLDCKDILTFKTARIGQWSDIVSIGFPTENVFLSLYIAVDAKQ